MDFGMLPPEINSGRMYTGPGSGSMRAAAAASGELATKLQSTVSCYSSVISTLTSGPWVGPSSLGMAARIKPLKDLKHKHSPEQLQRLVAQISEKPESVQHHTVDQEGRSSNCRRNPASTRCTCPTATSPKGDKPKVVRRMRSWDRGQPLSMLELLSVGLGGVEIGRGRNDSGVHHRPGWRRSTGSDAPTRLRAKTFGRSTKFMLAATAIDRSEHTPVEPAIPLVQNIVAIPRRHASTTVSQAHLSPETSGPRKFGRMRTLSKNWLKMRE